jgi:hypothetical protein
MATVRENIHVFLFRCEKCKRPIAACVVAPQHGGKTLEEAAQLDFYLHCYNSGECGWTGQISGQDALKSWQVESVYEKEIGETATA